MPTLVKNGIAREATDAEVPALADLGWKPETDTGHAERVGDAAIVDQYGGATGSAKAVLGSAASAFTGGLVDVGARLQGEEGISRHLEDQHGIASTVGAVVGSALPGGVLSRVSSAVKGVGGAGVAGAAIRGGIEGTAQGFGQGVHELALSDDPLTVERIGSTLTSNMLLGGVTGGIVGGAGKLAEKGMLRAKAALEEHAANLAGATGVPEDLANLDAKGLREAKAAELENIKASKSTDTKQFVEDLGAHREATVDDKTWLATKDAADGELREIGAMSRKADDRIRNILNNPKAIIENPRPVMSALTQQEHALQSLVDAAPKLRAEVGQLADGVESARLAALEKAPAALERNRALQDQLKAIIAEPQSARLDAIANAADMVGKAPAQSMIEKAGRGGLFGAATGIAAHIPVVGQIPGVAHLIGAKASDAIGNVVFGRLGNAAAEAASRTTAAIDKFMTVAPKVGGAVQKAAPILATKVLSSVRYAPEPDKARKQRERDESNGVVKPEPQLAEAFKARANELRSQVITGATGGLVMRPEARAQMSARLDPIAVHSPSMADQLETIAARRVEFLANKLPKEPDLPVPPGGASRWQPSELEMRTFARYAAAIEDPAGVEERLAHGTVTPEDAEAYKAVYPERFAHLQTEITLRLPELQKTLPFGRRLALSIFTGQPVDPAMDPRILDVLQGSFANDNKAESAPPDMQAPKAMPAFGSISKPEGTPAQERASR